MSKKTSIEAKDFNELKKLGFKFSGSQDEFSFQPDSGSIANGRIAKQENGVNVDLDAVERASEEFGDSDVVDDTPLISAVDETLTVTPITSTDRSEKKDQTQKTSPRYPFLNRHQ